MDRKGLDVTASNLVDLDSEMELHRKDGIGVGRSWGEEMDTRYANDCWGRSGEARDI